MDPRPVLLTSPTRERRRARSPHADRAIREPVATTVPASRSTANIAPQLQGLAVPIDSIELHPRNPRKGDVPAVTESLRRFGQRKPIVVQAGTRYVVAGNHLLMAARALRWTDIAANVQA